jgi:hypothetical protein
LAFFMSNVPSLHDRAAKALDYAQESVKQILALSTGALALTLTFFQTFAGAASAFARDVIFVSWILFIIAIAFGILALLSMTSNLWPKNPAERPGSAPDIWTSDIKWFAGLQIIFFALALIAMLVAGSAALGSHAAASPSSSPSPSPTDSSPSPSPSSTDSSPSPSPSPSPTEKRTAGSHHKKRVAYGPSVSAVRQLRVALARPYSIHN